MRTRDMSAKGPNQLRVGDKVRLRNGNSTAFKKFYEMFSGDVGIECELDYWYINGMLESAGEHSLDIVGIIRPARSTPVDDK